MTKTTERQVEVGDEVIVTDGLWIGLIGKVGAIKGTSVAICVDDEDCGHDCEGVCAKSGRFEPLYAVSKLTKKSLREVVKKQRKWTEERDRIAREEAYKEISARLHDYNTLSDCDAEWHNGFCEAIDVVEEDLKNLTTPLEDPN